MGIGIIGLQLMGIVFGLFMLYYTFLHKKRKEFTTNEALLWSVAWLIFITIAVYPKITDQLIAQLSFARRLDFFIVLGFIFLIGVTFHNYALVRANKRKLEYLVSTMAMNKKKK